MYQIKYAIIKNISSIKEMKYDFLCNRTQLLQGKNFDDSGQRNNGIGKSSFIDAIGFGITGLSLRKVTIDEMIRKDEKEAYIELLLETKDKTRKLLIKRYLYRKSPQVVEIYLNDEPKHTKETDVNSRNKFIIDEIGISQDDLFQFFLITKNRYKAFFNLSDTDKKDIIARFSNASLIDNTFSIIDKKVSDLNVLINTHKTNLLGFENKISTYQEEIDNLNKKSDDEYKQSLKNEYDDLIKKELFIIEQAKKNIQIHQDEINNISSILDSDKIKLDKELISIDSKQKEIAGISLKLEEKEKEFDKTVEKYDKEIQSKIDELNNIRNEILELNKAISEVNVTKSKIESKLKSSIECPKCEHEFVLNSESTFEELTLKLKEINDILTEISNESIQLTLSENSINKEIKTIRDERDGNRAIFNLDVKDLRDLNLRLSSELSEIKKERYNIENLISNHEKSIKVNKNKIDSFELSINGCNKQIALIERQKADVDNIDNREAIERYKNLIDELNIKITLENKALSENQEKLQNLVEWGLKFQSFKSYLVNQSNKQIESLINNFLLKMNSNITVELSGHQIKGKEVREKLTASILKDGFHFGSYGMFSGGERGRIDIAAILATQTLINKKAAPRGLDFILIDEVLESLDAMGIESIIRSMESIDKSMLLVTQLEINTLPEQTVTFIKKNKQTVIENGN